MIGKIVERRFKGAQVYQEDDGEYPAYEEDEIKPRKKRKLFGGVALLAYAVIGAGLAQTISINGNGTVEFGQGVVELKACDSFITITLNPSSATYSGTRADGNSYTNLSHVRGIKLSGLDTKACAGKKIKLQLFNSETTTAMSLYTDVGNLEVNRAILAINSDNTLNREDAVTIINGRGQDIGYFDSYQYVDYDSNRAEYTLVFTYPLALMSDITRVTIESTSA